MRVILKPGGLLLILGAFAVLVLVVVQLSNRVKVGIGSGSAGTLKNAGLEGEYTPVVVYDNKARLDGVVANGWQDDSSWASVQVAYAKDESHDGVHGGKTSQRIDIQSVERTPDKPSVVQFNQALQPMPNTKYRGSFFLKAKKPMDVEISLRQADWPYHYYSAKVVNVGTQWTEAKVEGQITENRRVYLMVKAWTPSTLWVDDASLQPL